MPLRKIMRTFSITFVAIALLVSACLFSACLSDKPADQTALNVSTLSDTPRSTPAPEQTLSPYISFEEVQTRLGEYPDINLDKVKSYKKSNESFVILFIQGMNVDTQGRARLWTFGIRTDNGTELRAFDRTGWTIIPLHEPIPLSEIIPGQVISPQVLLEQNRQAIFGTTAAGTDLRQIELKDGNYSVSSGQGSRNLRFNAFTGAPIVQNT